MKRSLTDELAVKRTELAEERTYLAYIRTGLSIILAGLFFTGYFQTGLYHWIGLASTFIGLVFLVYGFYHHKKSKEFLKKIVFFNSRGKRN
ncbi:DUF202 domain-containing protein [Candidatus Micrarchaeota archaeon]|nr:DUF202 domain-containing protein [Candidatus Micrarchaeota archaeon]